MKKAISVLLALSMLTMAGCGAKPEEIKPQETQEATATVQEYKPLEAVVQPEVADPVLEGEIIDIVLGGTEVTFDEAAVGVSLSNDIIYYEDKDAYESGNPYGDGEEGDKHTAEEAAAHIVVNITEPGNYRLCGKLDKGQIRVNLGKAAYDNPTAVVNLILDGVDITCTVAPAILFQNVYECDNAWSVDSAKAEVDTNAAGANLILAADSENVIHGSHVAKIYKDAEGGGKLWKQDGAIYSYMSMNVAGSGDLDLYADNEGLDTELHLTINGGNINIYADNDGINTNEDGVSVTTINNGNLHIIAGLGAEGDGIDSNGYLVINGGTVVSSAHPAADAGLDSDMGSYINGGLVIALGSTMDWAESDSDQVTMNLQFAQMQSSGSSIVIQREDGVVVYAYDPSADEVLGENVRSYQGAVISSPYFTIGESYNVFIGSDITGTEVGGMYDAITVTGRTGGVQQGYTSTDVIMGFGGFGGMNFQPGGEMPQGGQFPGGQRPGGDFSREDFPEDMEMPEGMPFPGGNMEDFDWGDMENFDWSSMGEGEMPEGGFPGMGGGRPGQSQNATNAEVNASFYMQDKVNFFSGLTAYTTE